MNRKHSAGSAHHQLIAEILARPRELTPRLRPAGGDGRYCVVAVMGGGLRKTGTASADAATLHLAGCLIEDLPVHAAAAENPDGPSR